MGTAEKDEKRPSQKNVCKHVPSRDPGPDNNLDALPNLPRLQRPLILNGQRFIETHAPHRTDHGETSCEPEDHRPWGDTDHEVTKERDKDRAKQKDRHHDGRDPSHLVAAVEISGDGGTQPGRCCSTKTPDQPGDKEQAERRRQRRSDRANCVQCEAAKHRWLATETIGDGPHNELANCHTNHIQRDNKGDICRAVESLLDCVEGRKRDVYPCGE